MVGALALAVVVTARASRDRAIAVDRPGRVRGLPRVRIVPVAQPVVDDGVASLERVVPRVVPVPGFSENRSAIASRS
jgi:hypothetical protein